MKAALCATVAILALFSSSVAVGQVSGFETLNTGHVLGGPAPLLERPSYPHASGEPDTVPTSGVLDDLNLGCLDTLLGFEVQCEGGVTDGGGGGDRGLGGLPSRSTPAPASRSRSSSPSPSGQSASTSSASSSSSSGPSAGQDCRG